MLHRSIGMYKIETVIIFSIFLHCHTSGNSTIAFGRFTLHPVQCLTVGALGHALWLSTKTGGEHFGQDKQVSIRQAIDSLISPFYIYLRIRPFYISL